MIGIEVYGTPAPQGSKKAFALRTAGVYTGKVAVMEQNHGPVKSWRQAVLEAAQAKRNGAAPLLGPLTVVMHFYLKRPKSHYRIGKNAGILKDTAPEYPAKVPDLSKLVRATEDALTDAGVWADDALVVEIRTRKLWDDTRPPGAWISIGQAP